MLNFKAFGNGYLRNIAILFSGTLLAQIIPFLALPVLSRLFTPSELGEFSVLTSVCIIIAVVGCLRYEQAIPLINNSRYRNRVATLCILISCIVALISFLFVNFFTWNVLGSFAHLVPIVLFFISVFQVMTVISVKNGKFKAVASSKVILYGSIALSQIALSFLIEANMALIGGFLLGYIFSNLHLLYVSKLRGFTHRFAVYFLVRYKGFSLINSWSALLNSCTANAPIIFIGHFFGVSYAGFAALAFKLVQIPVSLLSGAVSQVYLKQVSDNKDDVDFVKRLSVNTIKSMALISVVPFLVVLFFGEVIFTFILGIGWAVTGAYASILSCWIFFIFCGTPLTVLFNVYELHSTQLKFNIISFTLRCSPIAIVGYFDGGAINAIIYYTFASMLFWILQLNYIFIKILNEKKYLLALNCLLLFPVVMLTVKLLQG